MASKATKDNYPKKKGKLSSLLERLPHLVSIDYSLPDNLLTEDDFNDMFIEGYKSSGTKVLGIYEKEDIMNELVKAGIIKILEAKGYKQLYLDLDTKDPFVHRVTLRDHNLDQKSKGHSASNSNLSTNGGTPSTSVPTSPSTVVRLKDDNFLIDCLFRRREFQLGDFKSFIHSRASRRSISRSSSGSSSTDGQNADNSHNETGIDNMEDTFIVENDSEPQEKQEKKKSDQVYDFMKTKLNFVMQLSVVEWLCMQNPMITTFLPSKPQLPGQKYPGLGVGREMVTMMTTMAERQNRDGILNVPEHFHNGLLYFSSEKHFYFINPIFQAKFISLCHDLKDGMHEKGLAAVSWAFSLNLVKDKKNNKIVKWKPQEQIYPVSKRMKEYFSSSEYKSFVKAHIDIGRYYIDWSDPQVEQHLDFAIVKDDQRQKPSSKKQVNPNGLLHDELVNELNTWFDPDELHHNI